MIGRSPDIEGTRSVAEIHCEDALEPGMIGRSPDIEGTRSVAEIHCGIVVGNKEENNMTDNYNDDYREVIPKEEKTETDVSETQDNEKNNGNTQVADTAKENSTEKKSEDKKDSSEYEDVCFICRRPESKAGRMFKLPNHICICDDCMHKTMETVSQFDYQGMLNNPNDFNQFNGQNGFPNISFVNLADLQGDGGIPNKQKLKKKKKAEGPKPVFNIKDIPAPHKIKASLDEYVVGQEKAKKVISVAVYNHYKRVATDTMDEIEIEKSNILMIGPTGSGKTYLVKTLAKLLDVPLAIADATSLTEAGYIGDDIESVVSKLLAAAGNDVEKAEKGIIFIDEIDKIAKKKNTNSRDVSGESVQQGMLKLLEGAEVEVPVGANSKNAMVPLATVNTRNILFICGGAFPDLDEIIKERLTKTASIGFNSELKDKYDKDTDILSKVTVEDIRKFGMIPEFIGRLPIICTLQGLSKDMLVKILKEPKNAILKQYQKLLELDEVKLEFTDDALDAIAEKAMKRDTGARALRSIIEDFMLDIMYEIPKDDNIGRVTITREYIEGTPLSQLMAQRPEKQDEYLNTFVDIQLEILGKTCPHLNKIKDKMHAKISASDYEATLRYDLHNRLEGMKPHKKVLHGDYCPSNVIVTPDGRYYIIDWAHATQGNASADAARTYLTFTLSGQIDVAEKYLALFCKKADIPKQLVQQWMPIVACSESTKHIPGEREVLDRWVNVFDFQ